MKKIEIEVYEFNELDKKVQEKVIENYRDNMELTELDYEYLEGSWKEELKRKGYRREDKYFDFCLNHCQGDGVSLTGRIIYEELLNVMLERFEDRIDLINFIVRYKISLKIDNINSRYCNESIIEVKSEQDWYDYYDEDEFEGEDIDDFENTLEEIEGLIEKDLKDICRWTLEPMGYQYLDYIYSNEHIEEIIRYNNQDYFQNGDSCIW
jgi:hypothetical protein